MDLLVTDHPPSPSDLIITVCGELRIINARTWKYKIGFNATAPWGVCADTILITTGLRIAAASSESDRIESGRDK